MLKEEINWSLLANPLIYLWSRRQNQSQPNQMSSRATEATNTQNSYSARDTSKPLSCVHPLGPVCNHRRQILLLSYSEIISLKQRLLNNFALDLHTGWRILSGEDRVPFGGQKQDPPRSKGKLGTLWESEKWLNLKWRNRVRNVKEEMKPGWGGKLTGIRGKGIDQRRAGG